MHRALGIFILSGLSIFPHPAPAQESGSKATQLTVGIYNDASVPAAVLQDAERRAADIFAQAHFEVVWLHCLHARAEDAAACRKTDLPQHISLRIVRNPVTSTNDAVFGVAFLASDGTGKYSDVFWKRVEALHAAASLDLGSVLGSVMAHEMGHLLLGSNDHALTGIMRAHWEAGELRHIAMGSLLFTPQQVERMHGKGYVEEPAHQEVAGLRRG